MGSEDAPAGKGVGPTVGRWVGRAFALAASAALPAALALRASATEPTEPEPRSTFAGSVLAVQRYCNAQLRWVESSAPGSSGRQLALERLVAYLERERELYDGLEVHGVALWLTCSLGRARALSGDVEGAYRDLASLIERDTTRYPPGAREFVEGLKLHAFRLKARTAFADEDYDLCIRTVDAMLCPPHGYPWALDSEVGCAAWLLKARALCLRDRPDPRRAIGACRLLVERGGGDWPSNARQLMYKVYSEADRGELEQAWGPKLFSETALGAYQLALAAEGGGERRELLEEALTLYEKAIRACGAPAVAWGERLEVEPGAWLALGVCYSRLELWYESALAFEGLVGIWSHENVARFLAQQREFGDDWREFRDRNACAAPDADARQLLVWFHAAMRRDARLKALLDRHDARLIKGANNLLVACRRRLRESGLPFDEELFRRAVDLAIRTDPAKDPGTPEYVRALSPAPPPGRGEEPEREGRVGDDEEEPVF